MKIYVAHNFNARIWLREVLRPLAEIHHITSRWIYDDSHVQASTGYQNAKADLEDIDNADALILFLDQFSDRPGKGKYFEWGYAYGQDKEIILIGKDTSCVFANLNFSRYDTLEDYITS